MKIDEAMALAGMNPVVGQTPGNNIMINAIDRDKDLKDCWGDYKIAKTLDNDDYILSQDQNGKINLDKKEKLNDSNIAAFYINTNDADEKMQKLIKESLIDYDERPVHSPNYLYEFFTGHKLLSPDQPLYDPLLEEIDLPKFSKIISSGAKDVKSDFAIQSEEKEKKDGEYVPDGKSPYSDDE